MAPKPQHGLDPPLPPPLLPLHSSPLITLLSLSYPRTGGGSDSCCLLLPLPGTPSLAFLCGLVCVNCLGLSSNVISSVRSSLASLANASFHLLLSYSLLAKYPDLSSYYDYLSLEIILYIHSLLVVCLSLM